MAEEGDTAGDTVAGGMEVAAAEEVAATRARMLGEVTGTKLSMKGWAVAARVIEGSWSKLLSGWGERAGWRRRRGWVDLVGL